MSEAAPAKRTFKQFYYRGHSLEDITSMPQEDFVALCDARARRTYKRGLKYKHERLIARLKKARAATKEGEKPKMIKTHCRNQLILPVMIGSVVGVYNGKSFVTVDIKPEMVGHYLGEFSITYKPVTHGRPGVGATHSSKFVPLK